MSLLKISTFDWSSAPEEVRKIRHQVFVNEQLVPAELEWDEFDELAVHYLVRYRGDAIATARQYLLDGDRHIGRVAVDSRYRKKGIGRALMKHIIGDISEAGNERILISAQSHTIPFYQRLGFYLSGATYMEAGIPHVSMENPNPLASIQFFQNQSDKPSLLIGEDNRTHHFSDLATQSALTHYLLGQAQRNIRIMTSSLDRDVLDSRLVQEMLVRFAKRHSHARCQVLVCDEKAITARYHRFMETAKRLTSFIEIRTMPKHALDMRESLMIIDFKACIYQKNHEVRVGFAEFDNRILADRLGERFDQHWNVAKPSLELRRLAL